MSLQKFIETVFVCTFFYRLRNVGPNPGSPYLPYMHYSFFCNIIIIYNGKVGIKYLSRIILMNSQVADIEIQQWCLRLVKSCIRLATSSKYVYLTFSTLLA